jgi:hypothetical protein
MNSKKVRHCKIDGLWSVVHRQVATDTIVYANTIIAANSRQEAFGIFNSYVADDKWIFRVKDIKNVYPVEAYKRK